MNANLLQLFSSPTWTNLIFALLHSLWIGAIVAAGLAAALRFVKANRPERRYVLSLTALCVLIGATFLAWATLEFTSKQQSDRQVATASEGLPTIEPGTSHGSPAPILLGQSEVATTQPSPTPSWVAILAILWLAGTTLMIIRLFVQVTGAQKIRRASQPISDPAWLDLVLDISARMGLGRVVRLASCSRTLAPCVVGAFYPTILLPVSMMSGIPTEQLRAILAHELAHVRRHDYVVNLAQRLIESLLFFNPAVWWINQQIRLEREACCDAVAVSLTHEPAHYAEALTEWAEKAHSARVQLEPAFPGNGQRSSLTERIRRLLAPDHRPLLRLPWASLTTLSIVSVIGLVGMWRGSQFAVALGAQLLTPQQRIESIAALRAKYHAEEREYTAADEIVVGGEVKTEDGTPVPPGVHVHFHLASRNGSIGWGGVPLTNGWFREKMGYGKVHIAAFGAAGFGQAFLGPIDLPPGGAVTNLELILPRGFTSSIMVTDADDKPLPDVELEGQYTSPTGSVPIKGRTDEYGKMSVSNCVAFPMIWTAVKEGFQHKRPAAVQLRTGQPLQLQLQPAQPTEGAVIAKGTGLPVPGATVKLIHQKPTHRSVNSNVKYAPLIATADENGEFALTTLNDNAMHILAVQAPGFAVHYIHDVAAGTKLGRIEIGPELTLSGEVRGDLTTLVEWPQPVMQVSSLLRLGEHSQNISEGRRVPIRVENGVGKFEISNLAPGWLILQAGTTSLEYELTETTDDLVIELPPSAAAQPTATREVVIRFKAPTGAPAVRGQLKVRTASEGLFVAVTNGVATFKTKVPGRIAYETDGLVGYWTRQLHSQQVEPGTGPLVIEANAIPAGAVEASVVGPNGEEIGGVLISVINASENGSTLGSIGKQSAQEGDGPTRFVAQPLPLGGKYLLFARKGNQSGISALLHLTEEAPIQSAQIVLSDGIEVSGWVKDPAGTPMKGVQVAPIYQTPYSSSFGYHNVFTDAAGRFEIPGINPTLPGKYSVQVTHAGFQPRRAELDVNGSPQTVTMQPGATIRCVVINADTGKPLAGASVWAMPEKFQLGDDYVESDSKSDALGRVAFTTLEDRAYRISCREGELTNPNDHVIARPGGTSPIELRIKIHEWAKLFEDGKQVTGRSR